MWVTLAFNGLIHTCHVKKRKETGRPRLDHAKTLTRGQSGSTKDKQGFELACVKFFSNSGNFLFVTGRTKVWNCANYI